MPNLGKFVDRLTLGKFVDNLELEPPKPRAEVKVTYLGKPTSFEVLGYLHLPNGEIATPYSLGRSLGIKCRYRYFGFSIGKASKF